MISDEYLDFIESEINKSKIQSKELKDDLVDHFCCVIEIEMKQGLSFRQAYQKAFLQTSPNGFDEIQKETLFLLNYNKIMTMKRLTYLSGFIFTLSFTAGIFFKLMHLPGANVLMFAGITGAATLFAPLLLVNRFRQQVNAVLSERLKWIFGAASIVLFAIATWMKIIHLMGAGMMLFLAFVTFGFGFLPFLFFRMYKKSVEELASE